MKVNSWPAVLVTLVVAIAAVGTPACARAAGNAVYEAAAGSADSSSGTCAETQVGVFACSNLRAAINAADHNPGSTVELEPGVYQLGEAHGLPSSALAYLRVDASVTITGAGPEATTIEQTSGIDPVMLIPYDNSKTLRQISIEGVKLTGGVATGHEEGEEFGWEQGGGALRINASKAPGSWVTLFNDALVGNRAEAQTAHGGAIFNRGVLKVIDTTVAHNVARAEGASSNTELGEAEGGGIFNTGSMHMADSTIADNTVEAGGTNGEAAGGGIDSGIENFSNFASLEVVNTTITGNVARAGTNTNPTNPPIVEGGGMAIESGQLLHVTLYGNVASPVNAWVTWGGNLYERDGRGSSITSSVIANGSPSEHGNCFFEIKPYPENERNDLEDDAGSECGFSVAHSSILGVSPQLMPLAANGGPTETLAPMPSSPLIGAGTECGWASTLVDQRGMPRNGRCDIGAFQTEPPFGTVGPNVVGTAEVGQMLTCEPGSWTGEGTLAYAYEWLREGSSSDDQTSSYMVTAGDAGAKVACLVTATGTYGSTEATSPAVEVATPTTTTPTEGTTTEAMTIASRTTSTSSTPASGIARAAPSATVKNSNAQVKLTCADEGICTGSLKLVASLAQKRTVNGHPRKRVRNIVIGTVSFSIAEGKSETLAVHLSARGGSLLRTVGKQGLKVTVTGSDIETGTLVLHPTDA